ncbi:MAG: methyltransferase type 11 [Nitrospinae bacterium CG11_big_fil_rev_8_21_14_0_20_56_8]|nr:MAG: methyltransferase type 11 [Nitrospinae bacterium CG11_big_fil_rev_8_21_14_0_20_56_8]
MKSSPETRYDQVAKTFDLIRSGDTRRWKEPQTRFFRQLRGKTLYVGIGTGLEIVNFPPGLDMVAIDTSREMLGRSRPRVDLYPGKMRLCLMDAERVGFPDNHFDSILTVCVLCTVKNPVNGLKELYRVLKPGGRLLSFEHVLSRNPFYSIPLRLMSVISSTLTGSYLTRDTVSNIRRAGFRVESDTNVYLDIVKAVVGIKPA